MHGLRTKSLMHCRISSVRLNNVSSHFLPVLSNPASLHVSYQRLLQTIGVLEAQRTQAILDLETLARHQREALADPISFVEQLQKRVTVIQTYVLLYTLCFFCFDIEVFIQLHILASRLYWTALYLDGVFFYVNGKDTKKNS